MRANFPVDYSFTSVRIAIVEFLSIPPKYHAVVPPSPTEFSETIGPVFFNEMHGPIAP